MTASDSPNSSGGILPLNQRSVNDQLFASALAAAYRTRSHLYNPDLALARAADAWEKVQRFPLLAHAIQKRCHKVATRDWNLEPGGDEPQDEVAASIVEEMLRGMTGLPMARFRMAHGAILGTANEWIEGFPKRMVFRLAPVTAEKDAASAATDKGRGDAEAAKEAERIKQEAAAKPKPAKFAVLDAPPSSVPETERPPAKLTPDMEWWVPTGSRHIDYRRIRLEARWTTATGGKEEIEDIVPTLGSITVPGLWKEIKHRECLMRVEWGAFEGRLGYGWGMIEAIYWGFWIIETLYRSGLEGVDRWANGIIVASVEEAAKGSTDKTAQAVAAAFLETLERQRGLGILTKSSKDGVDVHWPPAGSPMVLEWIKDIQDQLLMLVTGSVRPSGGGEGGTYGQGKVEERSTDEIISFDRQLVDAAISETLIKGLIWRLNAPQFAAIGCQDARPPRFVSVEGDDEDPVKFGEVVAAAQAAGLAIVEDEAYRRFGLTRPGPGDKVIEPPTPPSLGGGMFGGSGGGSGFDPDEKA